MANKYAVVEAQNLAMERQNLCRGFEFAEFGTAFVDLVHGVRDRVDEFVGELVRAYSKPDLLFEVHAFGDGAKPLIVLPVRLVERKAVTADCDPPLEDGQQVKRFDIARIERHTLCRQRLDEDLPGNTDCFRIIPRRPGIVDMAAALAHDRRRDPRQT